MQLFLSCIVAATLVVATAQQHTPADNTLVPSTLAQIYQRAVEGAFSYRTYLRGAVSRAFEYVRESPTQPAVEGHMMQGAAVTAASDDKVHANGGCKPPTCFVYWPHHTKKPTPAPTSTKKPHKAEEAAAMKKLNKME